MPSKISIVTISFNQVRFLEECIQSVLSQAYENVEYIVVDPGSTDGSRDLIEKYRGQISTIIYDKDNGPADGLNKGFFKATGSIFGYINADDRLAPGALKFVNNYFSTYLDVDVMSGAINIINEKSRKSLRKRASDKFNLTNYAAGICTVAQQATFFRRKAFHLAGGFNPQNKIAWDGELLVDMALAGQNFDVINKVLADFRIYSTSITGSGAFRDKQLADLKRLQRKIGTANVKVYSDIEAKIHKVIYKFNLRRQLDYYFVK